MKITLIIVLSVAFLVVAGLLANVFLRKNKEEKPAEKKEEKPKEDAKKDDIPEILKEVTMGNYMYDNAKLSESEQLQVDMVENKDIVKEEKVFRVELGDPLDQYDDEPMNTRDILDQLDDELDKDIAGNDETPKTRQSVASEIKKASPTLKAMIIADVLRKKDEQ